MNPTAKIAAFLDLVPPELRDERWLAAKGEADALAALVHVCVSCGGPYIVSHHERASIEMRFGKRAHPPVHCAPCRMRRRQAKIQESRQ